MAAVLASSLELVEYTAVWAPVFEADRLALVQVVVDPEVEAA